MLFRISENASFVAPYHRIQKKELWLTTCFPWKYSKLSLRYRTEMDFWTSHLLKRPYSLEDSRASLKSLQYGVQFTRSLWVSLKEPEGIQCKSTTRCFFKTWKSENRVRGLLGAPKARGPLGVALTPTTVRYATVHFFHFEAIFYCAAILQFLITSSFYSRVYNS